MGSTQTLQVVLVKSGVTTWDATGRCSGSADLPLCPEGRQSVQACAAEIAGISAAGVMSSADAASLETARVLAGRIGGKVREVAGWAEPGMGLWEGQSDEELAERFPKAYRQWKQDPSSVSIPEAERLEEAQDRIVSEFMKVMGRRRIGQDRAVVAVLRPIALGLVVCWLEGRPLSELWVVLAGFGTCRRMEIDRARLKRPRIGSWVRSGTADRSAGRTLASGTAAGLAARRAED